MCVHFGGLGAPPWAYFVLSHKNGPALPLPSLALPAQGPSTLPHHAQMPQRSFFVPIAYNGALLLQKARALERVRAGGGRARWSSS